MTNQYCPVKELHVTDNSLKYCSKEAVFVFSDLNLHRPFWPVVCPELIGEHANESVTDALRVAVPVFSAL